MRLDYQLFELINRFAGQNDMLDQMVLLFSNYGPLLFGFVLVWLWFSTSGNKERNRKIVLYALTVMIIALGINKVIELMLFRPRPFVTYTVHLLSEKSSFDPSFPSNHSTGAFVLAFVLFRCRKKLGSVLLMLAVCMAISRVFIGVHYPSDVTAGAIIAILATVIVMSQNRYLDPVYDRIIQVFGKRGNKTIDRDM